MEWISVDDRLPEMDELVMVYLPNNHYQKIQFDTWITFKECPVGFSTITIETGVGWSENEFDEITHWMPLPEPPKEKV